LRRCALNVFLGILKTEDGDIFNINLTTRVQMPHGAYLIKDTINYDYLGIGFFFLNV